MRGIPALASKESFLALTPLQDPNKVLISFSFLLPLKQKNLYNKKLEDYLSTSTMENFPKSKQKGEVEQRRIRIFNVKSNFPSKKIFMSLVN